MGCPGDMSSDYVFKNTFVSYMFRTRFVHNVLTFDLLWLFGYIMFNNSHGTYVDRVLVLYAQEIAEVAVEEMPQYSWGSAVLVATYKAILTGCPILLQL